MLRQRSPVRVVIEVRRIIAEELTPTTPNLAKEVVVMKNKSMLTIAAGTLSLVLLGVGAISAQGKDKYAVKVPGGLAFSEFRGYESWQLISISQNGPVVAAILGNPAMIEAYQSGIPGSGKPFPDGAKMAKIHWIPKKNEAAPGQPMVAGAQHDVDFMVKDSKRFTDGGGWGYGAFAYDAATDTFTPADMTATPPQGNDAKCGVACHTAAKARDYVFTEYAHR
jgi:Cytochrome P460